MKKLLLVFMAFTMVSCKSYKIEKEYAAEWNYNISYQDSLAISSFKNQDSIAADINYWDYYLITRDSLIVKKNDTLKIFKNNEFILKYEFFKDSSDTVYCHYNYNGVIKKYYRYFGEKLMKIRENVNGEMVPIYTNLDVKF